MLEIVCIKQSEIIDNLSGLCTELLKELAQYKTIEAEEKRLKKITEEVM